ncbi:MAG: hypothetical protein A3J93_02180 [Candidatus Magasanikbacteria bacterium RIFOXYC2_FULL_42_28]|uniref:Uncharacterized protein n=1 Tax=Candidatus Magasanikbacteria bacterium RIFOXYC2_FULL_42_28 TaxID=1798704 RepID=A0A1F6NVK6_9BACT|nr:MAG: hypothetical protein A3J93_02180 [Candidatus Magasanikbacteria bacterium RIFOXYC2_FULL_42_28]
MKIKKWHWIILCIEAFATWFYVLNFVPLIPIQRPNTFFVQQEEICPLNYWLCYNDMVDTDTFPIILKQGIFTNILLPFFFPLILTWATFYFVSKKTGK